MSGNARTKYLKYDEKRSKASWGILDVTTKKIYIIRVKGSAGNTLVREGAELVM